ncbi:hypothetical protein [Stenomitos frigidus]|uniref:Uncharacterized protein n=1 Tax=Stenomitos frigidus ULC18 TaxID=2107698 RepID=A0A2T1E4M9_9CYAN|nr:hypothetical protein [Stenomitos frigidus]PSB27671.1 hypothetical protein C7B82_16195 [Stenomitos frigidus ULC18]
MLTPSENTSASWESNVWAQAVRMPRAVPAAVAEKLCQWAGSAVRSLILTTAKLQQQYELLVKQQVSTFEVKGVSVMF